MLVCRLNLFYSYKYLLKINCLIGEVICHKLILKQRKKKRFFYPSQISIILTFIHEKQNDTIDYVKIKIGLSK